MREGSSVLRRETGERGRIMWFGENSTAGVFFVVGRGGYFEPNVPLDDLVLLSDNTPFAGIESLTPEQILERLGISQTQTKTVKPKDKAKAKAKLNDVETALEKLSPEDLAKVKKLLGVE